MSVLSRRVLATIIDYSLFMIFCWIYVETFGKELEGGGSSVTGVMAVPIMIYWTLYFVAVEWIFGGTVAHRALGLHVLSLNGMRLGLLQTVKRRVLDAVDFVFFGIPAFILVKNTPNHQRIGDIWAKTKVVQRGDADLIGFEKF